MSDRNPIPTALVYVPSPIAIQFAVTHRPKAPPTITASTSCMGFVDLDVFRESVPVTSYHLIALVVFNVECGEDDAATGVLDLVRPENCMVDDVAIASATEEIGWSLAVHRGLPRLRCILPTSPASDTWLAVDHIECELAARPRNIVAC